jgi:hypothetical protein
MLWNNQTTKRNRCSISGMEGISTALNRTQLETQRLHRRSTACRTAALAVVPHRLGSGWMALRYGKKVSAHNVWH